MLHLHCNTSQSIIIKAHSENILRKCSLTSYCCTKKKKKSPWICSTSITWLTTASSQPLTRCGGHGVLPAASRSHQLVSSENAAVQSSNAGRNWKKSTGCVLEELANFYLGLGKKKHNWLPVHFSEADTVTDMLARAWAAKPPRSQRSRQETRGNDLAARTEPPMCGTNLLLPQHRAGKREPELHCSTCMLRCVLWEVLAVFFSLVLFVGLY